MIAFVYAGQGAQKSGMGLELYEQFPAFSKTIDSLAAKVPFDLKTVMFGQDDRLNQTEITQPALAAYAAAVTEVLKRSGITPDITLGLSLGEYSALYAAGVFTAEELVSLTAFRGQEMAKAGSGIETRMCAVLGLSSDVTEEICDEASQQAGTGEWVTVVNYNTVGQDVIAGTAHAVELAEGLAKERGAKRCMALKVSSAFHTSLMESAAKALEKRFKKQTFHPMKTPVLFNATGAPLQENERIADLLVRQVMSPVRMRQSIEQLAALGVTDVIEIGPGHAISGFVKRAASGIRTYAIEDAESLRDVLDRFGKETE